MLENRVFDYIKNRGNVSFVELRDEFTEFKGKYEKCFDNKNIILWSGVSIEMLNALDSLMNKKKITITPTSEFVYMCDGACLNLPIAKRIYRYKKPHWLPIVFNPVG